MKILVPGIISVVLIFVYKATFLMLGEHDIEPFNG